MERGLVVWVVSILFELLFELFFHLLPGGSENMSESTEGDGSLFALVGESSDAEKKIVVHNQIVIEDCLDDRSAEQHPEGLDFCALGRDALGDYRVVLF